ncbi:MAG TPA: Coq4 family protein [Acidimicrobiales bacterium]|nr:Coq4 family protein [Acidimicrobiales bacterium]
MTETTVQTEQFAELVRAGGGGSLARAAALDLRSGDVSAPARVAALCLSAAVTNPERLVETYDGLADGWVGRAPMADPIVGAGAPGDVPGDLWDAIWALVFDPDAGRDPADITVRTAALAGLLPSGFNDRLASMALRYPGVADAATSGPPPRFSLDDLARCPRDSLAGNLHSLVVDDGFDLEVLDRDALALTDLPHPLGYLNVRILQCHDVWHEVAGYQTTGLHEVGISGFQMGQFGHHYSSMFLGVVLTKVAFTQPFEGTGFLLDTILSAYAHGRETPPLIGVTWEEIWDRPVEEIRASLGVRPFESPYPPGILEDLRSA